MQKKIKLKNTKPAAEQSSVVEKEKEKLTPPSATPKKKNPSNEIDEIFAAKKRNKPEKEPTPSSATPKKQKPGSEIDEIFAGRKRKKLEKAVAPDALKKKKGNKVRKENGWVSGSGSGSRPRKRTGDGLAIYTEEELGFGRSDAGGTPLCPFDCDCCF